MSNDNQKPTSRMQEALLTLLAAHDQEVAAVKNAPTTTTLATLAADYTYAVTDEQRATLAADVTDRITLAEAGTIRRAAEAIKLGTPGIIAREAAAGTDTATIAAALGVTTSYVRRIIREHKPQPTTDETMHRLAEGIAAIAAGRRFSWRIDTQDTDGTWLDREHGEDDAAPATLAQLAERLLAGTGDRDRRARIFVWEGDEGHDAGAVYHAERDAQ
ncbi:hypothetical protein OG520_22210 [Streptomyces sp. NBC_00984]|uniref:hypothetical protein n=1 Tax=Streptomyces sp. NBC_00984 TaxID=2903700 RepID=UPI00386C89E1|nr:hypothetical protein OG520_22210 [Streptomyces sp. NBC_00984]